MNIKLQFFKKKKPEIFSRIYYHPIEIHDIVSSWQKTYQPLGASTILAGMWINGGDSYIRSPSLSYTLRFPSLKEYMNYYQNLVNEKKIIGNEELLKDDSHISGYFHRLNLHLLKNDMFFFLPPQEPEKFGDYKALQGNLYIGKKRLEEILSKEFKQT